MTEDELDRFIDAWIAFYLEPEKAPEKKENWWAVEHVMEWMFPQAEPDRLWQFITLAYKRDMPDIAVASLAAGPLEDLLAHHGPDYIDRIETLARQDPKFRHLLGGVWKNAMTEDIWQRVRTIRDETW
jgi:hypothetical protein